MQKLTRILAIALVVLAFLLALAAFGLARRHVTPQQASSPAAPHATVTPHADTASETAVVVAAQTLPADQPIPSSSLRLIHQAQPPKGSFTSIDAVADQMALVGIPTGTAITRSLLAHGMSVRLKAGERAVAIPVDEVAGVGNRVLPGDYVDVFLSLKNPQVAEPGIHRDRSQTRLLLSRLRVLAYGDRNLPIPMTPSSQASSADAEQKSSRPTTEDQPARTAVLAVPVSDVDRLLLGIQNGKLTLALRHPADTSTPDQHLFPRPPSVLSAVASLSPAQRQSLASPDNAAYAGVDGAGLAGDIETPRHEPHRAEPSPTLEIIRGTQVSTGLQTTGIRSP